MTWTRSRPQPGPYSQCPPSPRLWEFSRHPLLPGCHQPPPRDTSACAFTCPANTLARGSGTDKMHPISRRSPGHRPGLMARPQDELSAGPARHGTPRPRHGDGAGRRWGRGWSRSLQGPSHPFPAGSGDDGAGLGSGKRWGCEKSARAEVLVCFPELR